MRRRLSKPAIFQLILHVIAASFLASIIVVLFSQWWVFDLFSHFRIQYVLSGFLLLPALLWLKKYWVAVIATFAILFHSISLWPYLQGSRVMASLDEPPHLTVLFANIYYEEIQLNKVSQLLTQEKPDVIVFAEVDKSNYTVLKDMLKSEYAYTNFVEGEGAYDISYFSKTKPAAVTMPQFSEHNPSVHLQYDWEDKTVNIVGIHPHSPMASEATESRDKHLSAALEYAAQQAGPTLVIGDFNITQFSPKFPRLLKEYNFIDTQLEFGLQPSWHASRPPILRIPIDQAVVNDQIDVYDRYIGASTGSDHLPVIVKFGVK
jgi:endonuclease/exonuclease/phosphatase (EEP) superfamily protein YafD